MRAELLATVAVQPLRLGSHPWPTEEASGETEKIPICLSPAPRDDDFISVEWNSGSNIFLKVSQLVLKSR